MAVGEHANSPMGFKRDRGNFLPQQGWQQPVNVNWKVAVDTVVVKEVGARIDSKLASRQLAPIVGLVIALKAVRLGVSSAVIGKMHF